MNTATAVITQSLEGWVVRIIGDTIDKLYKLSPYLRILSPSSNSTLTLEELAGKSSPFIHAFSFAEGGFEIVTDDFVIITEGQKNAFPSYEEITLLRIGGEGVFFLLSTRVGVPLPRITGCLITERGQVSALGDANPTQYLNKKVDYIGSLFTPEKVSVVSPFYSICKDH